MIGSVLVAFRRKREHIDDVGFLHVLVDEFVEHFWRMCAALFIAAGSFFLGQQKVILVWMRGSPCCSRRSCGWLSGSFGSDSRTAWIRKDLGRSGERRWRRASEPMVEHHSILAVTYAMVSAPGV